MKSNSNAKKEKITNEPKLNTETYRIKKFSVTFTFKSKSINLNPIIVEMDFDESTRKILPNNKYFDKMTNHLKEWKHVVLWMWNQYLNDKIKSYNYNEKARDGAGDYCILFLFLEMASQGWLVSNRYWYEGSNFQRHWYEEENIKAYADRFGHYARRNGNDNNFSYLDNLFEHQMKALNEIIIPNDLPSEIAEQLRKLENFCQCHIVTPNTKNINFANKDQAANMNLSNEKLISDTSDTLNQIDVKRENHEIIKTPKKIKKKPVIKKQVTETKPEANLNSGTMSANQTNTTQNENGSTQVKDNKLEEIRESEILERLCNSEIFVQKAFNSVQSNLEKQQQTTNAKQSNVAYEEKIKQPTAIVEQKNISLIHKCNLVFSYVALILCSVVFIGVPLGAFLSGILFTLKIGIPVVVTVILSAIGFRFSLVELDKLKQQNSDILLGSGSENANYPKTFLLSKEAFKKPKNKFPFLNDINLKDRKDGLDNKNNQRHDIQ